jgi:hypothetical protein
MSARGDLIAFAKAQTRNFNQMCQAWTWQAVNRFGRAPKVYPSAYAAYRASKIVSKDPRKAPGGAISYWAISTFGHVAPHTGPNEVLMSTGRRGPGFQVVNSRSNLVLVSVTDYNTAAYLGWSLTNGVNSFRLTTPRPAPAAKPIGHRLPGKTATAVNGKPGKMGDSNCWARMQVLASHGGYTGAWDGVLPVPGKSWLGVQTYLHRLGFYAGDLDGDPKKLTYAAIQLWAGVKDPTITNDWRKISPANWRKIGAKLNTLK